MRERRRERRRERQRERQRERRRERQRDEGIGMSFKDVDEIILGKGFWCRIELRRIIAMI